MHELAAVSIPFNWSRQRPLLRLHDLNYGPNLWWNFNQRQRSCITVYPVFSFWVLSCGFRQNHRLQITKHQRRKPKNNLINNLLQWIFQNTKTTGMILIKLLLTFSIMLATFCQLRCPGSDALISLCLKIFKIIRQWNKVKFCYLDHPKSRQLFY